MKRIYLAGFAAMLLLASCGGEGLDVTTDSNALDQPLETSEDIEAAVVSFGEGGAKDARAYYAGVVAEVVEVDVKYREVGRLDNMPEAKKEDFTDALDEVIKRIEEGRKAMNLYTGENWNERDGFHSLTMEWFDEVEGMCVDYLYALSDPMSREDETWEDADYDLYEEYVVAYDEYHIVDSLWIEFQYVFAEANDIELSDEVIDEDALIEEDLENLIK